jgi:hypothetical protein
MKHLNVPAKFAFAMILTAAAVSGCKKQDADHVTPEATTVPTPAPAATPATPAGTATTPAAGMTTPPAAGSATPTDGASSPTGTTPQSSPPAH